MIEGRIDGLALFGQGSPNAIQKRAVGSGQVFAPFRANTADETRRIANIGSPQVGATKVSP